MQLYLVSDAMQKMQQQAAMLHARAAPSSNAHQVLRWTAAWMASIHGNPLCWVQAGSPHLHK